MSEQRPNYLRRSLGLLACFSPVFLAVASIVAPPRRVSLLVGIPVLFAACIALCNCYYSWFRGRIYKWRHGTLEGYRVVSGIPLVASIVLTVVVGATVGSRPIGIISLVLLIIDTGSLPWFIFSTWHDRSLWDTHK